LASSAAAPTSINLAGLTIVEVPTLFRSIALEPVESLSLSQVVDEKVTRSHGAQVMLRMLEFVVRAADERIGRLECIEQLREALHLEHGHQTTE
jgi:hypothetical protein